MKFYHINSNIVTYFGIEMIFHNIGTYILCLITYTSYIFSNSTKTGFSVDAVKPRVPRHVDCPKDHKRDGGRGGTQEAHSIK